MENMETKELEIKEIETVALSWPEKAAELIVSDQASYDTAAETLKDIARLEKQISEHYKPMKEKAQAAHKEIIAAEKKFLDPLIKAKTTIKERITDWVVEQNRIKEENRKRLLAEAFKREEEERLARAVEAEKQGKPEEVVNNIIDIPKPITPVRAEPTFERSAGVSIRETWRAEVVDLRQLCEAIVAGKASVDAVAPNMPYLNGLARADKDRLSIPGVVAIKESSTSVRT
jgi:hypothetical protein